MNSLNPAFLFSSLISTWRGWSPQSTQTDSGGGRYKLLSSPIFFQNPANLIFCEAPNFHLCGLWRVPEWSLCRPRPSIHHQWASKLSVLYTLLSWVWPDIQYQVLSSVVLIDTRSALSWFTVSWKYYKPWICICRKYNGNSALASRLSYNRSHAVGASYLRIIVFLSPKDNLDGNCW